MDELDRAGVSILIFAICIFSISFFLEKHKTVADAPKSEEKRVVNTSLPTETPKEQKKKKTKKNLITVKLTAYCPCHECSGKWGHATSTGVRATEGRTVAVDPQYIPYGTYLRIDGKVYKAEDCGSAVKGHHVDVFFENHDSVTKFGTKKKKIEILDVILDEE